MNEIITQANYVISLITGEMTDEVRQEYKKIIVDYDIAINCFEIVLENLLPKADKLSTEEIITLIETEYEGLNLNSYLGEFNTYIKLIKFFIKVKLLEDDTARLNILKEGIEIADELSEDIKYTIYYVTLSSLVFGDLIKEDVNFAKTVINYVQNYSTTKETKALFRVYHQIINRTNK